MKCRTNRTKAENVNEAGIQEEAVGTQFCVREENVNHGSSWVWVCSWLWRGCQSDGMWGGGVGVF